MPCDPLTTNLVISEPVLNLPNVGATYDQLVFEEYGFHAYTRMSAPHMAMYNDIPDLFGQKIGSGKKRVDCAVIVDSGYSFTHIVPFWRGKPILVGIRRINVGGKLLTNHLKEIISFRPLGYAWQGGQRFASMDEFSTDFKNRLVTRAEYLEIGSALCESRFRAGV
ncbi:Actin- protein 6 [Haplosporangium bisporale]|nr:Actin- protein 6 [Haplosporangium bisporale]